MARKQVVAATEFPLRLEWRSPAELAENPRNWRQHPDSQMGALSSVLAEVGWAGACLFNERTGRLIDGPAGTSPSGWGIPRGGSGWHSRP